MGLDANPTSAVNPSLTSIQALADRPDNDAFIMVNLLKFAPDGGREAYARYGAVASGTVRAHGGSIAYTAPTIDTESWDSVTLVRYPRRAAYLDMQSDPAYIGAIPDRTRGLSARLLYPFHNPTGDADNPFRIERSGGDEVFVVRLLRHPIGGGPGPVEDDGTVVLRLQGDTPMVSDGIWDELIVTRYPSLDELHADNSTPSQSITLITRPVP